ncbi:phosphatase PAP2 family protein [Qipengyuania flava]|uniref:phosphatase PAP2 family protein n=1 Tax=Qipengyuania flava TaxID=192812 RepID=UPI001C6397EB|nr:phosphatase PAP2 family protein [Qipengyuania flava]QYJ08381.1 phosphatase PAP2 family protein [Qipengyuania flava]
MVSTLDITLFEAANQLAGRSFTLDALMALAMENPVIKGGPLAACFLFAWWHRADDKTQARRRATLLVTLATLFLIAPLMKVVSTATDMSPRPLVMAEQVVMYEDGALHVQPRVAYTPPATGLAARLAADARAGRVANNDLASFPSDHAALFVAFAVGIFLATRSAGIFALGWTFLGILLPRVATGMHWPSDMAAGALAGLVILAVTVLVARGPARGLVDRVAALADRHRGWAQAALFLLLVEAASAMETLQRLVELVIGILTR